MTPVIVAFRANVKKATTIERSGLEWKINRSYRMEFTEFMLWKAGIILVAAAVWNFWIHVTGRHLPPEDR